MLNAGARGFTLIEVVVVMAIAGILAAIAYPSVLAQVQRTRRTDALAALMQIESAQARFRSNSDRYGTLAEIGLGSASVSGYYTLQSGDNNGDGYSATAIATGSQSSDTPCRYIKFAVLGADVIRRSGADEGVGNPADLNKTCWSL